MTEILSQDSAFKDIFSDSGMVEAMLRRFAPKKVVAQMDFSTLKPFPTEHITEDGRKRQNDIVWRVSLKGRPCFLLFMLEAQSVVDWWMPTRVLVYTGLLWQHVIKVENLKPGSMLPPVFPLVLYDREPPWTAPTSTKELLGSLPPELLPYQPLQEFFLLDIGRVSEDLLAGAGDLATYLVRMLQVKNDIEFRQAFAQFCKMLPPGQRLHLHRSIIGLARAALREITGTRNIGHCETLQEAYTMLADAETWGKDLMEQGKAAGRAEGIAIGMAKGQQDMLLDMLANRFGDLPENIVVGVGAITDRKTLGSLLMIAMQAESLEEFTRHLD